MQNNKTDVKKYGFIYTGIIILFDFLNNNTLCVLFQRKILKNESRVFYDINLLFNTILSFVFAAVIINFQSMNIFAVVMFIWVFYRMYEITLYAVYSNLTHRYKSAGANERVASVKRDFFLLLINITEIINCFTVIGAFISFLHKTEYFTTSFFEAFKTNFHCFLTQDITAVTEKSEWLDSLAFFQVALGLFFIIVCVTHLIGSFKYIPTLEDEDNS